jgi:hypothetical protein
MNRMAEVFETGATERLAVGSTSKALSVLSFLSMQPRKQVPK